MDGPRHYQRGDESFQKARMSAAAADGASAVLFLQSAQFHATMALAAAVAQLVQLNTRNPGLIERWNEAFNGELKLED